MSLVDNPRTIESSLEDTPALTRSNSAASSVTEEWIIRHGNGLHDQALLGRSTACGGLETRTETPLNEVEEKPFTILTAEKDKEKFMPNFSEGPLQLVDEPDSLVEGLESLTVVNDDDEIRGLLPRFDLQKYKMPFSRLQASPHSFYDGGPHAHSVTESERPFKRKALLIGIQYKTTPLDLWRPLDAPFRDVRSMQNLLRKKFGWHKDEFTVLLDNGFSNASQPTYDNIVLEMKRLVEDAQPGDRLFFYYSGHGLQVEDEDNDEDDGQDEAILTCDGQTLLDDTMHEIMVQDLPKGCNLTAIFDCCSSGTGLDLPFQKLKGCGRTRYTGRRKHSEGNVVLLSACADYEKAHESKRGGLFTAKIVATLHRRQNSTFADILDPQEGLYSRPLLRRQTAQLSSSFDLDINSSLTL